MSSVLSFDTFDKGVLAIHSSSEGGRLHYYDPAVVIASPELRVGEPRETVQADSGRKWTVTLIGLERVEVPLGTFGRALVIRVDMTGRDFASSATHYFAPRVGLVAYHYDLKEAAGGRSLLSIDASLRLARLGGVDVASAGDLDGLLTAPEVAVEDRGLREQLRKAIARRYTWDAGFTGFRGDARLTETGKAPIEGSFVVGPDLSVRVEAADASTRAALQNEISSFVTQRKASTFDLTYADTTFVRTRVRSDGAVVVTAAGDALATTFVLREGEVAEVGRSLGRVAYTARDRTQLRTDDGRSISVEYDVVYTSIETKKEISIERTRDSYARLGPYWVPVGRRVEAHGPGQPASARELTMTGVRTP